MSTIDTETKVTFPTRSQAPSQLQLLCSMTRGLREAPPIVARAIRRTEELEPPQLAQVMVSFSQQKRNKTECV